MFTLLMTLMACSIGTSHGVVKDRKYVPSVTHYAKSVYVEGTCQLKVEKSGKTRWISIAPVLCTAYPIGSTYS